MKSTTMAKNKGLQWLRYWRNSLADAESGQGAQTYKDFKVYSTIKRSCFRSGKMLSDDSLNIDRLFEKEPEEVQAVRVLFRPVVYKCRYEHGKKRSSALPDYVTPVICSAWVGRCGTLLPAGVPAVPRDLLTPQPDDQLTLWTVRELDTFYTKNEVKVVDESEVESLLSTGMKSENVDGQSSNILWSDFYKASRQLFSELMSCENERYSHFTDKYLQLKGIRYVKVDSAVVGARNILNLYDWLDKKLDIGMGIGHNALFETYAFKELASKQACLSFEETIDQRLGHSNSQFPMASAQRDALTHAMKMQPGEILAVNGPPGTGKTTFVLSVVASWWVKAAIEQSDPPIIIAASTNNQAVTNVISAFGKDFEENESPISGRWLPGLNSYGGYLPAESLEKKVNKQYQTASFYRSLEDVSYYEKAKILFIQKGQEAFPDEKLTSVKSIQTSVREKMVVLTKRLLMVKRLWEDLNRLRQRLVSELGDNPKEVLALLKQEQANTQKSIELIMNYKKQWFRFCLGESIWLRIFCWLPPVARRRSLLKKLFIQNMIHSDHRWSHLSEDNIDEVLSDTLSKERDYLNIQKERYDELAALTQECSKAERDWSCLLAEFMLVSSSSENSSFESLAIADIDAQLDRTVRFELFQLAVHYWEAQWLLSCEQIKLSDKRIKKGRAFLGPHWRRRMMLTPCVVSTLHSLPKHMSYSAFSDDGYQTDYFLNEIDLLIVDEAGQVSPEVAGASFALAKRALVIGDTHQIEPVRKISAPIDIGNLLHNDLITDRACNSWQMLDECMVGAKSVVKGSVMHIAQQASRFHYLPEGEAGMYLREHRRCYDEIIEFCNLLCYQGLLLPKRGMQPSSALYPAMSYMHVDGFAQQTTGSNSKFNQLEANLIANWLSSERAEIEAYYGDRLESVVAVVTPFKIQKAAIETACIAQGIDVGVSTAQLTVGTVHALQGAERPIVLFSAVYSRHSDGKFIDSTPSMLNVAISRAKDSFMLFADMDTLSSAPRGTPRRLLEEYMGQVEARELSIEQQARPDLLSFCQFPRLINDADQHDAYLKQLLLNAKEQVDIVSPWISFKTLQLTGMIDALIGAVERGVSVSIYTDHFFNTTEANSFDDIKAKEFHRCCERISEEGVSLIVVRGLHSKMVMADSRFMGVGSFNWCSAARRGKYMNMETSMVYSGDLSREIEVQLNALRGRVIKVYECNRNLLVGDR